MSAYKGILINARCVQGGGEDPSVCIRGRGIEIEGGGTCDQMGDSLVQLEGAAAPVVGDEEVERVSVFGGEFAETDVHVLEEALAVDAEGVEWQHGAVLDTGQHPVITHDHLVEHVRRLGRLFVVQVHRHSC